MTKPSYEELEREQRWIMQNWYRVVSSAENRHGFTTEEAAKLIHERVRELDASLARVRGLLQRLVGVEELFSIHFFAGESVGAAIKRVLAGCAETGGEKAAPDLDLESETPAGLPLTVGVEGDQLVIRMGVDTLAFCFEISESNQPFDEKANDYRREWKVTDRHKFAKGVCCGLMNEREDGSTPLSDLIDKAYTEAIESDMGVDEDGRIVTNEMLHPSPNFPRTSHNQTVSSGVEGAHEGITADKSELLPTQLPKEKN